MGFTITSPAFNHNGEIPVRHTCDGEDCSPALVWAGLPQGTKSLALVVDDPDAPDPAAPKMTYVHWVLYNIPPTAGGLPEGVTVDDLPAGTQQRFRNTAISHPGLVNLRDIRVGHNRIHRTTPTVRPDRVCRTCIFY